MSPTADAPSVQDFGSLRPGRGPLPCGRALAPIMASVLAAAFLAAAFLATPASAATGTWRGTIGLEWDAQESLGQEQFDAQVTITGSNADPTTSSYWPLYGPFSATWSHHFYGDDSGNDPCTATGSAVSPEFVPYSGTSDQSLSMEKVEGPDQPEHYDPYGGTYMLDGPEVMLAASGCENYHQSYNGEPFHWHPEVDQGASDLVLTLPTQGVRAPQIEAGGKLHWRGEQSITFNPYEGGGSNDEDATRTAIWTYDLTYDPDAVAPACSDGADNDGDGGVDYAEDIGCESAGDQSEDGEQPPLSWEMAERFDGDDHNGNGLADYFTGTRKDLFAPWPHGVSGKATQIDPDLWRVDLVAGGSCRAVPDIKWVMDTVYDAQSDGCTATYYFPARQSVRHSAAFVIKDRVKAQITFELKDFLIVSLGDSYASGEGVPDRSLTRPRRFSKPSEWQDKQCHRSAKSAAALAAARVENADPHTSVTFVHLACSGGTIKAGLLGRYGGAAPDAKPKKKSGQVTELKRLLRRRVPDAVFLSVGGNDIGFSDIIIGCVKHPHCPSGPKSPGRAFAEKIKALPGQYAKLAARLNKVVPASRVRITKYPDATRHDSGVYCGQIKTKQLLWDNPLAGGNSALQITSSEAKWASTTVLRKLNKAISRAAKTSAWRRLAGGRWDKRPGWRTIGGHLKSFKKHGYCARDHWLVQFDEAKRLQEAVPDGKIIPNASPGTLHPNAAGQRAYAKAMTAALKKMGIPK